MDKSNCKHSLTKRERQQEVPYIDALEAYVDSDVAPFDVPGHKMGGFENEFMDFIGKKVYECDVNAPIGLDSLLKPHGVIKKAEALCAEAFDSDYCQFSVSGTSGGIIATIIGVVGTKEKIILPRNIHKSIISALIISGATPVFMKPDIDSVTGIANGVSFEEAKRVIDENLDAKAILIINPTYFGITSDLKRIADYAHSKNIICIADEAHGTHFYFNKKYPLGAMQAGFDLTTASMHKTGGSLTQSSIILGKGKRINFEKVRKALNMIMSTSPSTLLIASIDAARKRMYFDGKKILDENALFCKEARNAIKKMPGLFVMDDSYLDGKGRFALDPTKLVVNVSGLGLTGFEVYKMFKERFNIQLELGEISSVLAIIGVGTSKKHVDRLINAFEVISKEFYGKKSPKHFPHFSTDKFPDIVVRPRTAYNAPTKIIPLNEAAGEICAESIMIYPPGIPFLIHGERITTDAVKQLRFDERNGGIVLSDSPKDMIKVIDRNNWYLTKDIDPNY